MMNENQDSVSAIINGDIFDGEKLLSGHAVMLRNGLIADILVESEVPSQLENFVDVGGDTLIPGFIDLQVNGGGGVLLNDAPTVDSIRSISAAHRPFGTTGFLPTVITDTYDVMVGAIAAVKQSIEERVPGILGIHLEGPFLNRDKRGIHDAGKIRAIDKQGLDIATSLPLGKTVITVAPESVDEAAIGRLVSRGVIVCAGHSAATYNEACSAIDSGVSGVTHLFNAMSPLQSREPGMVGAALASDDVWFGIIADGYHVHPATFKVAVAAKRRGSAILVTDAMQCVGYESDSFLVGDQKISVVDGRCTNEDGVLAGSSLDMITAVDNAARFAGIDWLEAVRMATEYPARAMGLEDKLGRVKSGFVASLIAVDGDHNVTNSWIDGNHVRFR